MAIQSLLRSNLSKLIHSPLLQSKSILNPQIQHQIPLNFTLNLIRSQLFHSKSIPNPQMQRQIQHNLAPNLKFVCQYHDGRPRGPLWRGKKMIGKEALFAIMELKRFKNDEEKMKDFVKKHVMRLLKMDKIAVLIELERQEEVDLALKMFKIIQKEDWYKPDVYLYKDLIISLARSKKMEEAMQIWQLMKNENLFPDSQTYAEVIRGFLKFGSPKDCMNIYEDMKKSPHPPEELPFRVLLKGLLPHPLLRNKVKQDFEELFPEKHIYDPPEEIFGMR